MAEHLKKKCVDSPVLRFAVQFNIFHHYTNLGSLMKKQALLLSLSLLLFAACKNDPPAEVEAGSDTKKALEAITTPNEDMKPISSLAEASDVMELSPNTAASFIEWTGSSATGSSHSGTIRLLNGSFHIIRGNLKRGVFEIDMNSIAVNDLQGADKSDLENHLKDADFFDVAKHPTGQFEIAGFTLPEEGNTGITHNLKGKLTLKGITKVVMVPVKLAVEGNNINVTSPEFTINRTDWGIKYNSGMIGTVKDKIISDEIKLKINVVVPVKFD
jgi:polyisoprenoid-binding protein YceI